MAEDSTRKNTTGDTEENYQTYLHDVLADLGIQLSPGGMRIVEIDRSTSDDEAPGGDLLCFADSPPEATEGNIPTQRENTAKKRKAAKTEPKAFETSCDISSDEGKECQGSKRNGK